MITQCARECRTGEAYQNDVALPDLRSGPLYYQLKSYETGGGTGFAIFEVAAQQKDRLKLLLAINRDEVVRYAAPYVRADSGCGAWLVVPGEIRSSGTSRNGSSLYLFKDGLLHVVE